MRVARLGLGGQPQDVVRIAARPGTAACAGAPAIRDVNPELRSGEAATWGAMAGLLPVATGRAERDGRRIDGSLLPHAPAVGGQASVLSPGSVVAQGAGSVIPAVSGLTRAACLGGTPEVDGGADF